MDKPFQRKGAESALAGVGPRQVSDIESNSAGMTPEMGLWPIFRGQKGRFPRQSVIKKASDIAFQAP